MAGLTLVVALSLGVAMFFVRPVISLVIYFAALAWYPSYITVKLGTVDFNVCRILIIFLYAKLMMQTSLSSRFRWTLADKAMIVYFLGQIAAWASSVPMGQLLENRAGAAFDMLLPYFAVRMIIVDRESCVKFLKMMLVVSVPLAIVGVYQCLTGNNPFGFFRNHYAWSNRSGYRAIPRWIFYRTDLTFPMSIMYGLYYSMFAPMCVGVLGFTKKNKYLILAAVGMMFVGVFTSMSSGPMLAGLIAVAFICCWRLRKYWKVGAVAFLIFCCAVEVVSDRHFYDVIGNFTLSSRSAWYRTRLFEVALFEGGMNGHWISGYGMEDPGWGDRIDYRDHTDIVNHFVLVLVRYGLLGLIPFLAMNYFVIRRLVFAFDKALVGASKWLVWCISAALVSTLLAMGTVSLFAQPTTIYYTILAIAVQCPLIVLKDNAYAHKRMIYQRVKMMAMSSTNERQ